jgi:hypothetical protein
MRFEINTIGKFLIKRQSNEILKFICGGLFIIIVFYAGIRYGMDNLLFMYITFSILYVIFFIFIPINLKIKINKTIQKIEFLESQIRIETKKGVFYLNDIEIMKVKNRFSGFGKTHTNGYILKNKNENKEYWLIETFFNEIEEIEYELKKHM